VAALHQGAQGQKTWLEDPPPWLCPAYYFASVIVLTEKKCYYMSDRFICFILTVKQSAALAACVLRATIKKGKKCIRWSGLRIVWPRNDPTPLLQWRLHLLTCLAILVTWKWPGCLDFLAPPLTISHIRHWASTPNRYMTEVLLLAYVFIFHSKTLAVKRVFKIQSENLHVPPLFG